MSSSTSNPALDLLWARTEALFEEWYRVLEMSWLDVQLQRCDGIRSDDDFCAADTTVRWQYRQAVIKVYLPNLAHLNQADLAAVLVHELVHVLIAPMESEVKDKHTDKCELAIENVTRAILAARNED